MHLRAGSGRVGQAGVLTSVGLWHAGESSAWPVGSWRVVWEQAGVWASARIAETPANPSNEIIEIISAAGFPARHGTWTLQVIQAGIVRCVIACHLRRCYMTE